MAQQPRLYTVSQRYNAVLDFLVLPLSGFYLVNQYRWGSLQSDAADPSDGDAALVFAHSSPCPTIARMASTLCSVTLDWPMFELGQKLPLAQRKALKASGSVAWAAQILACNGVQRPAQILVNLFRHAAWRPGGTGSETDPCTSPDVREGPSQPRHDRY